MQGLHQGLESTKSRRHAEWIKRSRIRAHRRALVGVPAGDIRRRSAHDRARRATSSTRSHPRWVPSRSARKPPNPTTPSPVRRDTMTRRRRGIRQPRLVLEPTNMSGAPASRSTRRFARSRSMASHGPRALRGGLDSTGPELNSGTVRPAIGPQVVSTMRSKPASSFGSAKRFADRPNSARDGPGPGSYNA